MQTSLSSRVSLSAFLTVLAVLVTGLHAQQAPQAGPAPAKVTVEPARMTLPLGEKGTFTATVTDAQGRPLEQRVTFFSSARRSARINAATGEVEALGPGTFTITARVAAAPGGATVETKVEVIIPFPAVSALTYENVPTRLYQHTTLRPNVRIDDVDGGVRTDIVAKLTSSNPSVIQVTPLGLLKVTGTGSATITATAEGVSRPLEVTAVSNPATSVRLTVNAPNSGTPRTGDVLHVSAQALNAQGGAIEDMPIEYSFRARTVDHDLGSASSGLITEDGRFVADLPGEYTLIATAGNTVASETVAIAPRDIQKMVEVVGRGRVADRKTSDLWVWTAPNGKDYAVTGTWGADGMRSSGISPTPRTSCRPRRFVWTPGRSTT